MRTASLKFIWRPSAALSNGKIRSQGSANREILEADNIFSGTLNRYSRRKQLSIAANLEISWLNRISKVVKIFHAERQKSFCTYREDTWIGMWWWPWFTNRREAFSICFHMNTRCTAEASTWVSFSIFLCCTDWASRLRFCALVWSCKKAKIQALGHKSWVSRTVSHMNARCITASSKLQEEVRLSKQTSSLLQTCHYTILLYQQHWVRHYSLADFFFFLKTDCSEYSLESAGSVPQLLQWLWGQTPDASHKPVLLFYFFW